MNSNNDFLLIGLPQSGKSTFIAALWHVVESGELPSSFKISSLPEERSYLNTIREAWLKCKSLERNKVDQISTINLQIEDTQNKLNGSVTFPDVSGEMYRMQFETRKLSSGYYQLLKRSNGILLFINPNDVKKPILISEWNSVIPAGEENMEQRYKPWEFSDVPTQVMLVDLLQIAAAVIDIPCKIGIVISAWDVIISDPIVNQEIKTPEDWLKQNLPLLYQYIKSNFRNLKTEVFGISAQGGNYDTDTAQLYNCVKPSDRIKVQKGTDVMSDISQPLRWLLTSDNED